MTTTIKTTIRDMPKVIMADPERLDLIVDAAYKIDAELKSGDARLSDKTSDDFINRNFKRTWRRQGAVKKNDKFGTDYDYFNAVVQQALALWRSMAGGDPDPDEFGRVRWGSPERSFANSLAIWENKKRTSFNAPLEGPMIEIGPTVDYGLFLEAWAGSETVRGKGPYVNILHRIGIMHALAEQLQADWQGAHKITVVAVEPDKLKGVSERPGVRTLPDGRTYTVNRTPIKRFPLVRILPRHW
jgi:hypothetical protein